MAGEKSLSDGKGNSAPTGARLQKAVAELREASKFFPAATSMIEGLQGAKEAAVEEMVADNNALRAKLTGLNRTAAEVEIHAKSASADAARVAAAELELQTIARSLDEKATGAETSAAKAATAAEEVQVAISTLKIKIGEKEFTGTQALGILVTAVTQIPQRVKTEVERVVSAKVETDDGKEAQMSGAELVSHLVTELGYAKGAAGEAVRQAEKASLDAEHANELLTEAGAMVTESNDAAMKAEQAAAEAKGLAEGIKVELADVQKDLRVMFNVVMAVLRNNGLNTDVTDEMMAEAESGVEEDASKEGES